MTVITSVSAQRLENYSLYLSCFDDVRVHTVPIHVEAPTACVCSEVFLWC